MMLEAVSTSETLDNSYETTRRNIREGCHLRTRLRENLKSHRLIDFFSNYMEKCECVCSLSRDSMSSYRKKSHALSSAVFMNLRPLKPKLV
jgi:hypothetical protein